MVSSATAREFRPGTLATSTPVLLASSQSIVFVPEPARTTRRSESAAARTLAVTEVLRTTKTSMPLIALGRVVSVRAGSTTQSWPRFSMASAKRSGRRSATRMRIEVLQPLRQGREAGAGNETIRMECNRRQCLRRPLLDFPGCCAMRNELRMSERTLDMPV
jgi:hypothetical protein